MGCQPPTESSAKHNNGSICFSGLDERDWNRTITHNHNEPYFSSFSLSLCVLASLSFTLRLSDILTRMLTSPGKRKWHENFILKPDESLWSISKLRKRMSWVIYMRSYYRLSGPSSQTDAVHLSGTVEHHLHNAGVWDANETANDLCVRGQRAPRSPEIIPQSTV